MCRLLLSDERLLCLRCVFSSNGNAENSHRQSFSCILIFIDNVFAVYLLQEREKSFGCSN
jgi:hypothetical protein